ncbi:MAG: helix-turn-helix domain-containing protein [Thermoplasmata archaeon]
MQLEESDEDFREEYSRVSKGLQLFGLTEYQARTYTGLVVHGVADAETIASEVNLPRTSVYKSLDTLHKMGYVIISEGRPRIYRPAEPLEIKARLSSKLDDVFGRLNALYEILSEKGEPQVIYTISGRERVIEKISEFLKRTDNEIIISSPIFSNILSELEADFQSLHKRGVVMTVITEHGEKVLPWAQVERRDRLIATDIISDCKRAILASPNLEVCGYTNNPSIASHLVNFVDILMRQK